METTTGKQVATPRRIGGIRLMAAAALVAAFVAVPALHLMPLTEFAEVIGALYIMAELVRHVIAAPATPPWRSRGLARRRDSTLPTGPGSTAGD
ncbi:hypothetical protein [Plantactinospora sp. GCM10030261]|uniref:hypothetical protein n=1 Tax=Plantactinospora sp. GCM10030261 TaxID=3273420 RepID=UPI003611FB16